MREIRKKLDLRQVDHERQTTSKEKVLSVNVLNNILHKAVIVFRGVLGDFMIIFEAPLKQVEYLLVQYYNDGRLYCQQSIISGANIHILVFYTMNFF